MRANCGYAARLFALQRGATGNFINNDFVGRRQARARVLIEFERAQCHLGWINMFGIGVEEGGGVESCENCVCRRCGHACKRYCIAAEKR